MRKIENKLVNYQAILDKRRLANNLIAKRVKIDLDELSSQSESNLWAAHSRAVLEHKELRHKNKEFVEKIAPAAPSMLDLKIELARRILSDCHFCERRCGANRIQGETGYCGVDSTSYYSSEFLHWGEEPELVPSHTIFFSGCTFSCCYCQNWEIAACPSAGRVIELEEMARIIKMRHAFGSKNVNFVGGNPDPHLFTILRIIKQVNLNIAMIWNSNMYHSSETASLLEGIVDLYLADLRYGNDRCAGKYSDVGNYFFVVSRNFSRAFKQADVILRHLVIPNHLECCTKSIMQWVHENIPTVYFNLMFQYHPEYKAHNYPEINRILNLEEKKRALELAEEFEIEVC